MTETDIMRGLQKLATKMTARLFRMNVGVAWVGEVRKNRDGSITIRNPRPFKAGVAGMSDLCGWMPVTITQGMVGERLAVFTAVEVKTNTGRPSAEQIAFIAAVRAAGGYAGIARNDEGLTMILCPSGLLAQGVEKNAMP